MRENLMYYPSSEVGQTYQGWSNKETWLVSLWLNNGQGSYELLCDALRQPGDADSKAEWLESQMQQALDELEGDATLWTDLLRTAFGRVSWIEVIEKN